MNTTPSNDTNRTQVSGHDTMVRGLAIAAVIGVHWLAGFSSTIYTQPPLNGWVILFDQYARMSVPLFVAFSGYGLSRKYRQRPFSWRSYLKTRLMALMPGYLGWSLLTMLVLSLAPMWSQPPNPYPLWQQLVLGRADYQLYFVPMLFQLYLLFPGLYWLVRRWPGMMLVAAAIIQIGLFMIYQLNPPPWLISDQQQYLFGMSWIFYVTLGMVLADDRWNRWLAQNWQWLGVSAISGLWLMVSQGWSAIMHDQNIIAAMSFTRWPVMVYAGSVVTLTLTVGWPLHRLPMWGRRWLQWLGCHSYALYLSHTLLLRALFSFFGWF